jgi:hypothetical protein
MGLDLARKTQLFGRLYQRFMPGIPRLRQTIFPGRQFKAGENTLPAVGVNILDT